jgi:hypothetical protein
MYLISWRTRLSTCTSQVRRRLGDLQRHRQAMSLGKDLKAIQAAAPTPAPPPFRPRPNQQFPPFAIRPPAPRPPGPRPYGPSVVPIGMPAVVRGPSFPTGSINTWPCKLYAKPACLIFCSCLLHCPYPPLSYTQTPFNLNLLSMFWGGKLGYFPLSRVCCMSVSLQNIGPTVCEKSTLVDVTNSLHQLLVLSPILSPVTPWPDKGGDGVVFSRHIGWGRAISIRALMQ